MNLFEDQPCALNRRQFFGSTGIRLGGVGLGMCTASSLLAQESTDPTRMHPPLPGLPNFAPKAQNVIYLHMNGGPAQIDLWDYKPRLAEYFDKELPESVRQGQRITTMTSGQSRLPVAPSMFKFQQHGQSGTWVSELLPHTARCVDDIAVVKSVHTNAINHDPACTFVMTGSEVPGKPSLGSWLSYGLGSDSNDLPSFVVLTPTWKSVQRLRHCSHGCGRAAFCRVNIRVWHCGMSGIPCYMSRIRRVSVRKTVGRCWIH